MSRGTPIAIVGAGLVGSLLALRLTQLGFDIDLFERRPDPRKAGFLGGRSINLALSERGLRPLREAGLANTVLKDCVMMRGRMIHDLEGRTELQRYGIDDSEVNWSVSRGRLNLALLDAAEAAGARLHFGQTLKNARFASAVSLEFAGSDEQMRQHECRHVLGCDGAGSALRHAMHAVKPLGERVEPLQHGYKELEIPAASDCSNGPFESRFRMEPYALHIWPRGGYMCIALPNREGNYTVTLFLPLLGEPGFSTLAEHGAARALFEREFADAVALMPDFDALFRDNPIGELATLYLDQWQLRHQALLLGDASHAIVPFHGQGMNAGFEDVDLVAPLLAENRNDPGAVIEAFGALRKPDADAIAQMALENYIEMRDSVADPHYLLKRELAAELVRRCPEHFMPRYRMVTFTHLPYRECLERGRQQSALMEQVLAGRSNLDEFDLNAAANRAREELTPLPAGVVA